MPVAHLDHPLPPRLSRGLQPGQKLRSAVENVANLCWGDGSWRSVRRTWLQADARLFDALRGTDTSWRAGDSFEGTDRWSFQQMIGALGTPPEELTLIDIGSAKGKTLVLASELGFRRIVGYEVSHKLAEQSRANLRRATGRSPKNATAEVRCEDARTCNLPVSDSVFFCFNPFDDLALDTLLSNIWRSWIAWPRRLHFVYYEPLHAEVFERHPFLRPRVTDWPLLRGHCNIYSTATTG